MTLGGSGILLTMSTLWKCGCGCDGAKGARCGAKGHGRAVLLLGLTLLLLFVCRGRLQSLFAVYVAVLVLLGLVGLARVLVARFQKLCWERGADPKGRGSVGHPPSREVRVPPHTYKRPDLMIYSQQYLRSHGIAVTWDNPDVSLWDGTAPVSSHDLAPSKAYRIQARVWNSSNEAPAINALVRFHYLGFGIGTVPKFIGQTLINVAVRGSPGSPALADMTWTTPDTPGHYCIQVEVVWVDDANPANNIGQENVDVKRLNSPNATFEFLVRNPAVERRTLRLVADSYALPPRTRCPEVAPPRQGTPDHTDEARATQGPYRSEQGTNVAPSLDRRTDPFERHRPERWSIPTGWQIEFHQGDTLDLEAGEERLVSVRITAGEEPVAKRPININAFDDQGLVGGVTLYVHS